MSEQIDWKARAEAAERKEKQLREMLQEMEVSAEQIRGSCGYYIPQSRILALLLQERSAEPAKGGL